MVSKKKVKKKKKKFFFTFLIIKLGKSDMVLGKKVAIFDWEWGPIGAEIRPLEMGRKSPGLPNSSVGFVKNSPILGLKATGYH